MIRSGKVTALALHYDGGHSSLPRPKRFKDVPAFGFELVRNGSAPVAERIFCQVENVRVTLTRSLSSRLVRTDLVRTGRMKYNPH